MPKPEYKGFSGYFGSYAQRSGEASMLRLRMPAGRVTKQRLAFVAGALRSGVKRLHFTTCQTIQLHDLVPEQLYRLIEGALDVGIIPLGGGGDFPRNVMCSPLAGAAADEYFDVTPWAEAAGDYLLHFLHAEKMPRKLKVGFSSSPANLPHATFATWALRPGRTACSMYTAPGAWAAARNSASRWPRPSRPTRFFTISRRCG